MFTKWEMCFFDLGTVLRLEIWFLLSKFIGEIIGSKIIFTRNGGCLLKILCFLGLRRAWSDFSFNLSSAQWKGTRWRNECSETFIILNNFNSPIVDWYERLNTFLSMFLKDHSFVFFIDTVNIHVQQRDDRALRKFYNA